MTYSSLDVLAVPYALHIVLVFPLPMGRLGVASMVSKTHQYVNFDSFFEREIEF